ncbi:MAG TPA: cytochrome c oxidase subunit II [Longimicrobiaceae bacterium]|nr:cytochrome c oxidase subunit II [Longimicrobiaceae bacterium]
MTSPVEPARHRHPLFGCRRFSLIPRRDRVVGSAFAAALLLAAGCGGDAERYPQTSLDPKSDFGIEIDDLWNLTLFLGVGVSVVTFAILAYILFRFRYRPDAPQPKQVHGNTMLEIAWTLIPAILISIIAVPTVRTIFFTYRDAPADALTIDVLGRQWWWEFRYETANGDTVITANEVHVPVGRTVVLQMTSADVVHSFWIPQMGGKRDVIANRVTNIVFTPIEAGVYLGQCAEFCGESHALMRMRLIAHEPAEFERWLANEASPAVEPTDPAVVIGQQLVTGGMCAACHTVRGTNAQFGRTGPDLTHIARRSTIAAGILDNNAENMMDWVANAPAIKPGALMPEMGLSEQELRYIVAYLQTLY